MRLTSPVLERNPDGAIGTRPPELKVPRSNRGGRTIILKGLCEDAAIRHLRAAGKVLHPLLPLDSGPAGALGFRAS